MAKTFSEIFEAVSLDVSSANERTRYERSFRRRRRAETATRRETARRALFEATSARSSTVCGCLPSVRISSLALVSKSALAKEKERAVNFGSSRKSAEHAKPPNESAATTFCVRGKKIARSKTFHPNRISLWVFRVVSSAQNSRRRRLTSHTKSNILSCFFSSEAQPRNARDLRVRALALRRCCAFSAAGADTTSRASPVARHERPHRVEEDRGRTHDAVGVRRGCDGAGPAQHASRQSSRARAARGVWVSG